MSLILCRGCGDGTGDCCRVGKVCFETPTASTLALGFAAVTTIDLSAFGLSSTASVFVGMYEGQSATYKVNLGEDGALAGYTTVSCAEVRSAWVRLSTDGLSSWVNCWCRVTVWYTDDDVWHVRLEFAGASDGSGTVVTVEDSIPLQPSTGSIFETPPTKEGKKNPAAWSNGSAGSWWVDNPSTCCRNGTTCRTPLLSDDQETDSVGVICCVRRYATPVVLCGPFPELLSDYVIRIADAGLVFMVGGKRHVLDAGDRFCDIPAGKTLLTPISPQPDWACVGFNKCTGEGGTTSDARSLVVPASLKINEYGSIFTGATGPGCEYGLTPINTGDTIPFGLGEWRWDTLGSNGSFGCSDPGYGCYQMPDLTGWTSIDVAVSLVSQCPYYEETGWDEELDEPILTLVPGQQYYECLMRIGCGIVFSVLYRSATFDPADPKTPGAIGAFNHVSTTGSPPSGMTVASTISFTSAW